MGIDESHLVLETLRDADNQVVDQRSDCAESGDVLTSAVVQLDVDDILLGVREVDCEMAEVLAKLALEWVRCATCWIGGSVAYLGDPRLLRVLT
jgi:hypothetical protein